MAHHPLTKWKRPLLDNKAASNNNISAEVSKYGWCALQRKLPNKVCATDQAFLDDLLTLPITPKLDGPPSFDEVEKAALIQQSSQ